MWYLDKFKLMMFGQLNILYDLLISVFILLVVVVISKITHASLELIEHKI